jgi:hypothetical protein
MKEAEGVSSILIGAKLQTSHSAQNSKLKANSSRLKAHNAQNTQISN